ncbi:hypothetical protein [Galbibacter sp.]|jgi:hypothetical protein|uniref:hypothetical protein n=1 Tax=Galbibacter sp. TaxID=2918471 RepID=UPI003A8CC2DD
MYTIKKYFFALAAVALLGVSFVSCTNDSVADTDALYNNSQSIDKGDIVVPPGG